MYKHDAKQSQDPWSDQPFEFKLQPDVSNVVLVAEVTFIIRHGPVVHIALPLDPGHQRRAADAAS